MNFVGSQWSEKREGLVADGKLHVQLLVRSFALKCADVH